LPALVAILMNKAENLILKKSAYDKINNIKVLDNSLTQKLFSNSKFDNKITTIAIKFTLIADARKLLRRSSSPKALTYFMARVSMLFSIVKIVRKNPSNVVFTERLCDSKFL